MGHWQPQYLFSVTWHNLNRSDDCEPRHDWNPLQSSSPQARMWLAQENQLATMGPSNARTEPSSNETPVDQRMLSKA
jgi:hypothetical protein